MQVSLRGLDTEMTEKIFDVPDINALLQQMSGKTVPQTVKTEQLMAAGFGSQSRCFTLENLRLLTPAKCKCMGYS
jgi:hypothetical protein